MWQTPRASNGSSWVHVVKKGKTSGKGKGVHIKQQAKQQSNGVQAGSTPRHPYQWRQISERETAACTDCSRVQCTGRIGALWRQRPDATPRIPPGRAESQAAWSKTDRIAWSVISRCQKRLAEAEIAKVEAEATTIKETGDVASYQARLAELEPLLGSSVGFRTADGPDSGMPEWLANTLSSIAKDVQESSNIDRDAVAQSLVGLLVPAPPPIQPDALRSGTLDNTTNMCDVSNRGSKHESSADWPQNTDKVRLTTKTMAEEETPQLEETKGRRR